MDSSDDEDILPVRGQGALAAVTAPPGKAKGQEDAPATHNRRVSWRKRRVPKRYDEEELEQQRKQPSPRMRKRAKSLAKKRSSEPIKDKWVVGGHH